jgi:hypothetical protein
MRGEALSALIVWEPVIASDTGPPAASVLSRLSDTRSVHFWDEDRSLSKALVQEAIRNPSLFGTEVPSTPDTIVWDFVAVFPPGARWDGSFPQPVYYGAPVVEHIEQVNSRLVEVMPQSD